MNKNKTWVTFQLGGIRDTKVTRERLGDLILKKEIKLLSSNQPTGGDWEFLIECCSSKIEEISDYLKAYNYKYASPVVLCGSQMIPIFSNPEDEKGNICSKEYMKHVDPNSKCKCMR